MAGGTFRVVVVVVMVVVVAPSALLGLAVAVGALPGGGSAARRAPVGPGRLGRRLPVHR